MKKNSLVPEKINSVKARLPIFSARLLAVSLVLVMIGAVAVFTARALAQQERGRAAAPETDSLTSPRDPASPGEKRAWGPQQTSALLIVDDDFLLLERGKTKDGAAVACPGAAYSTIQDAVNAAAVSGDTIQVCAGTYAESVLINKSVTLLGAQAGQNANTRFAAFTAGGPPNGPKANPAVESIITAAAVNPTSNVNNTVHVMADNVIIDGFVVDGNNPALPAGGAVVIGGINTDSRRGIQTEDAAGVFFPANNVTVKHNVIQNFAQRGVQLINGTASNTAPATSGSLITENLVRNFGVDGIVLFFNAHADITNNTVICGDYPDVEAGIWIQDFLNVGPPIPVTIANNNVTVGQDNFGGIWVNLAYLPDLKINNNTVNAAVGVTGASDFTFGIYISSQRPGSKASLGGNIVGASGGQFSRGIALWNLGSTTPTTVTGGTIGNSLKGLSLHDNDPNFGLAGAVSVVNTSLVSISGNNIGAFVDTVAIPTFTCNNFAGNTTGVYLSPAASMGLIANNNNITGNGFGMKNDGPAGVNAQANWWGAANGPGPVGPGSGDTVSTNVDFSNWLTSTSNCPPPCPTNVALASYGATVSASSTANANFPASAAINGEHNGAGWGAGTGGWNDGTRGTFPDSITVNLNVVQTLDAIDVYTLQNNFSSPSPVGDFTPADLYGIRDFHVQYFNGSIFVDVPGGAVTGNTRAKRRFSFPTPIATDMIRIVINDSGDHLYSRVVEIEAFSCAPVPVATPTPTPTPTATPTPEPTPCASPGNNVALATNGSTAVASSTANANFPAAGAIDGEHNGNNWGAGGAWNDGTRDVYPDNIQVNFIANQTIREIDVYTLKNDFNSGSIVNDTTPANLYGNLNFNVQYWTGTIWIDVPGGAVVGNILAKRKFIFPDITTDRIRVVISDSGDHHYSRVVEIEAFACSPAPFACVNPGGTGGCFASIQAAHDAVSTTPGTNILVYPGTYTENVIITKSVRLLGAQRGIDARGRSAPESTVSPLAAGSATFLLNASMTTASVDGFTFTGGTSLGVIQTQAGSDFSNLQIANNRFSGYSQSAVFMNRGGANITIDRNVMDGSSISGSGQAIFGNGPQSFAGLFITNNNIINNTGRYGFFVDGNHNVGESAIRAPLISGNLFNNNLQGLNLGSRSFGTLGVPVLGPYGGTISNNTFSNHAANGIQGGIQHVLVTGNTFSNNTVSGLVLTSFGNTGADRGGQNSNITCNRFTANGSEGMFFSASQGVGLIATNLFNNNNVVGNFVGVTYNGTETINGTSNWWGNATGPNIATNPGGTGDKITNASGGFTYSPFLTSAAPCAP